MQRWPSRLRTASAAFFQETLVPDRIAKSAGLPIVMPDLHEWHGSNLLARVRSVSDLDSHSPSQPRPSVLSARHESDGGLRGMIAAGHLKSAESAARELHGQISLSDALELTALIARNDRVRGQRAAARWLQRWLAETPSPMIGQANMIAGCLASLGSTCHLEALASLRATVRRTNASY